MRKFALGLVAALLVVSLLLAGCAPRPTGGQTAAQATPGEILVDLPALVLDFGSDGTASVGGIALGELMTGGGISLPADTMAGLTNANIQHVQLDTHPVGITLRVNGLPMLGSVTYDAERLENTMAMLNEMSGSPMLAMLDDLIPVLSSLVPLLDNLGMGIIARFPIPAGMEAIPLEVDAMSRTDMDIVTDFRANIRTQPRISLPIVIAPDGSWTTSEIGSATLLAALGDETDLSLPADTVAMLASAGIARVEIHTEAQGLSLAVNGYALPLLTWDQGEFQTLLSLAALAGLDEMSGLLALAEAVLPLLQVTDLDITLLFPDMSTAAAG